MTTRLDGPRFAAVNKNLVPAPAEAITVLHQVLPENSVFAELCAGDGQLIRHLEARGHTCAWAADIEPRAAGIEQLDAASVTADMFSRHPGVSIAVTNPPFARQQVVPILQAALSWPVPSVWFAPIGWLANQWFRPFAPHIRQIAAVGRVRLKPGTPYKGTTDYAWLFMERTSVRPFVITEPA